MRDFIAYSLALAAYHEGDHAKKKQAREEAWERIPYWTHRAMNRVRELDPTV